MPAPKQGEREPLRWRTSHRLTNNGRSAWLSPLVRAPDPLCAGVVAADAGDPWSPPLPFNLMVPDCPLQALANGRSPEDRQALLSAGGRHASLTQLAKVVIV